LALDREATLKKAEKFLRQGRLDAAIAEYRLVVEDQPRDWNTANTLGDLHMRAGQTDKALAQYSRIAQHFADEGFYPKAAALYKKSLKISPEDESIQLGLADVSAKQGLLADAKAYLTSVAARRRARGDRHGAAEIAVLIGSLDPGDFDARVTAARELEQIGDTSGAAARFKALYSDLLEKGRTVEAVQALRDMVRLNPEDKASRAALAKAALESGDLESAAKLIDRESAGDDPVLLTAIVELDLRSDRLDKARELLTGLLTADRERRHSFLTLAWSLCAAKPEAAFVCVDAAVDSSIAIGNFEEAAAALSEFSTRVSHHIPALLKLVEVCVDGGLESTMYEAQTRLADAYLEAGQAAEARVIAEDLVAREPSQAAHVERFRRALVMLGIPDPESHIAERVSGASPSAQADPLSDLGSDLDSPVVPTARQDAPEPAPSSEPDVLRTPEAPAPQTLEPAPQPPEPPATQKSEPWALPKLELPAPAAPTQTPSDAAPLTRKATDEIDLTSVLRDLRAAPLTVPKPPVSSAPPTPPAPQQPPAPPAPSNLDQVFQTLRTQTVMKAETDYSAQYVQLARTYLEMNMVDEAMSALETAVRSPRQRFVAASMLGRLHAQRGRHDEAIEWLERAAQAPAPTVEESHALLYDLGVLLDGIGETARALAVFLELQAEADDYRDVPARIDRLARVQTGG
jgi:periplasmic protein TonB